MIQQNDINITLIPVIKRQTNSFAEAVGLYHDNMERGKQIRMQVIYIIIQQNIFFFLQFSRWLHWVNMSTYQPQLAQIFWAPDWLFWINYV